MDYAPELHWRFAAQWNNHTWESFCALDGDAQADAVATYEAHNLVEAVLTESHSKKKAISGGNPPRRRRG